MSELYLMRPKKFEDSEKWIVYVIKDGLSTGISAVGNTPEEATQKAQVKIDQGKGELEKI